MRFVIPQFRGDQDAYARFHFCAHKLLVCEFVCGCMGVRALVRWASMCVCVCVREYICEPVCVCVYVCVSARVIVVYSMYICYGFVHVYVYL